MSTHQSLGNSGLGWNTGATPEKAEIIRLRAIVKSYERDPLIAAAADLLAALKNLLDHSGHLSVFGSNPSVKAVRQAGDYIKAVDAARAAIAKAEGTS